MSRHNARSSRSVAVRVRRFRTGRHVRRLVRRPHPRPRAVAPTEGIDISHWQGDIDWTQVRAAGKAFAFMKASEDIDYVDTTYGLNRARAKAAGFVIGAYHFAQPDPSPGDAIAEADHFLATASIADGDLPPVLDLEKTGGLTPALLQAWARDYLERIRERTGVRGVVYTSPNFWNNNMAGTDWFATNGYRVVWVAHWTTLPHPDRACLRLGRVRLDVLAVHIERDRGRHHRPGGPRPLRRIGLLVGPHRRGRRGRRAAPPKPPFTDIRKSKFRKDIAWLYAEGITAGCSKTKFCPNDRVTRGQMASFLARALHLPEDEEGLLPRRQSLHARVEHQPARQGRARPGVRHEAVLPERRPDPWPARERSSARVLDLSKSPQGLLPGRRGLDP